MSHEIHKKGQSTWNDSWTECQCSYCFGKNKLHYGLNIPKLWNKKHSWYVFKYWKNRYVRFAL